MTQAPRAGSKALGVPRVLSQILEQADVQVNGHRPWDPQVHRPRFIGRVMRQGSLGMGESYMDGDWDCEQLDELICRLLKVQADARLVGLARLRGAAQSLRHGWFNLQSRSRAFIVGERHYDLGDDLFEAMLDPQMVYSCACWDRADTLDQAQADKLELICRKLQLQPGMRLLDIGCGWGALAAHAARHHGARVTGVTVSQEQQATAQRRCAGLPVRIRLQDWRDDTGLEPGFDRVVSVGMFEHVGQKNHALYLDTVRELMAPDGLFLLHTIGTHVSTDHTDPWIDRYIFPNGKLPSAREIAKAAEGRLLIEDWHNFGPDYDRTLMAWHANFERACPELSKRYSERFARMWRYYLLGCAGFFRSRQGQLWQLVLGGLQRPQAYRSVRLPQPLAQ